MKFQEERDGDGKPRVKLKDKESIYGVLRGDPYEFRQHWVGNRSQICPGEGCEQCAAGVKASFRFRLNLVSKEGDKWTAKVLEQGWKVYEQLRSLNSECTLDETLIKITRSGSGQNDTTYTVIAIPKPVPANELNQIKGIELVDLVSEDGPAGGDTASGAGPAFTEDDIPF
jgi:hypothetical protein